MYEPKNAQRPLTTEELLSKAPPIPHAHGANRNEPKASALTGCPIAPGKASMSEAEKAGAKSDAIKQIFGRN
jgi:hypothetical protein